jgi:hypothetical protein
LDPADLERLLDRELKQLPRPHAPRTLLPRVLAATIDRADSPALTGWFTWPRAWQAGSVAAVALLIATAWTFMVTPPRPVTNIARTAGETATIMRALWQVLLQPVATYVLVLGVMLALACAAAWAAFEVALGGASQR